MWALIASLFIGNLMLLVLNLPLVGIWVKLLKIPRPYLYAGILLFASLGAYAVNADPLDLVMLLILGLLGFAMRRFGWPVAPAVIGLILGPVAETNLRRAIAIGEGNPAVLVQVAITSSSVWSWPCSRCASGAGGGDTRLPLLVRRVRSRRVDLAKESDPAR